MQEWVRNVVQKIFSHPSPNPKPGSCKLFDKKTQTKWHHIVVYCTWPDGYFPTKHQSNKTEPTVQTQWQPTVNTRQR